MSAKKKDISKLVESIGSIMDDAGKFGDDLKKARDGIVSLQSTLVELDDHAKRIQENVARTVKKLDSIKHLSISDNDGKQIPVTRERSKTKSQSKNELKMKKSSSRTDSTKPAGIMIFICPEGEDNDRQIGDSTCIPRRQLVPTSQEEKMILDYLIQKGHKPNQREYNRVYREISTMLIKAPKNAVAIELRVGKPEEELKTVELFFHVKVKDSIQFADFRYVRYKGADSYRIKNPATV